MAFPDWLQMSFQSVIITNDGDRLCEWFSDLRYESNENNRK